MSTYCRTHGARFDEHVCDRDPLVRPDPRDCARRTWEALRRPYSRPDVYRTGAGWWSVDYPCCDGFTGHDTWVEAVNAALVHVREHHRKVTPWRYGLDPDAMGIADTWRKLRDHAAAYALDQAHNHPGGARA